MPATLTAYAYLLAAVLFILGLRGLSHPDTARNSNRVAMVGMAIAIITTAAQPGMIPAGYGLILLGVVIGGSIGVVIALRIRMTALPQLIAAFHSLVGLSAVFVAAAALYAPQAFGIGTPLHLHLESRIEMSIGLAIGAITFTGAVIAFAKLQGIMSGSPIQFPGQHKLNLAIGVLILLLILGFVLSGGLPTIFWIIALFAFILGVTLIIPIGGADMPVVISMLNSYSGWAAAGIGFTLGDIGLIIPGSLVGASGAILSYIMCKGMNRNIINVLLGGFGGESGPVTRTGSGERSVRSGNADDAAFILKNAAKIIIVPGYGMAVAQAQHALREMAEVLKAEGIEVKYAVHPVAGRMPGHMNVLLAEANVPYDEVFELEDINNEFSTTDVAYVIGANDVTNPAARTDTKSPIFGMPILEVEKAKTVLFVKRSLSPGYAGVPNELFYRQNTMMLFGDAKKMTEEIVRALKG